MVTARNPGTAVRNKPMNHLKHLWEDIVDLFKQASLLPWKLAGFCLQRKQRAEATAREAERLDRIRNPSKYLGK